MEIRLVKLGRLILSVLFIFSAISKLLSLAFFDGLVAELFIGKDYYDHADALWYTQVFTRVIISGELLLGLAVLQETLLKKVILPVIQLILLAFTIHLFYVGFTVGFIGENCGCFGDLVPMDNLESIIKNVIAMVIGLYVWKFHTDTATMRFPTSLPSIVGGVVCLMTLWLTIKDYSPAPTIALPNTVETLVPEESTIEKGVILQKQKVDSLVNNNDFEAALELMKTTSIEEMEEDQKAYIERLQTIVDIQKNN